VIEEEKKKIRDDAANEFQQLRQKIQESTFDILDKIAHF
jgi:hypothetical protein